MTRPRLHQMGQEATRRYKVGVLRLSFESHTVWAKDPDHAASLVMTGEGIPAESWGPLDAVASAAEMGTPDAETMHLDAKHWLVPNAEDSPRTSGPPLPNGPKL